MMDSIVYLVSNPDAGIQQEILISVTLKQFIAYLLCYTVIFIIFICFIYNKISTNYERQRAEKHLYDNNKEHEDLQTKHFKIRDELIQKDGKSADTIRFLKQENSRLERKIKNLNKEKDDAIFISKRRGNKIKKMEFILRLENPELQLSNPDRSMSSIIKGYEFSDNI